MDEGAACAAGNTANNTRLSGGDHGQRGDVKILASGPDRLVTLPTPAHPQRLKGVNNKTLTSAL